VAHSFADDGSTDASIFPAHGTGANAVSWAPSVLSTTSNPSNPSKSSSSTAQLIMQKRFVSAGSDNLIRIWSFDEEGKKWAEDEVIKAHEDWVRDVAWAPNIGLPGMYVASASQVRFCRPFDSPYDLKNLLRIARSSYIIDHPQPHPGLQPPCSPMLPAQKIFNSLTPFGESVGR